MVLGYDEDGATITVTDDGIGLRPVRPPSGYGLTGPRRARRGGRRHRGRLRARPRHPGAGEGAVIRVLLVDDHPVVRSGLAGLLGGEPGIEVVGEAGDGAQGVALATELRPDLVLMDLRMPAWTAPRRRRPSRRRHVARARADDVRHRHRHPARGRGRAPPATCSGTRRASSWSRRCARRRGETVLAPRWPRSSCGRCAAASS